MTGVAGATPTQDHQLSKCIRAALVVAGVVLVLTGVGLFLAPPSRSAFPPQCASGACVASVDADPTAMTLALVGIGALLAVVGLNGRVLTGLKVPGAGATMAEEQKKDAEAKAVVSADVQAVGAQLGADGDESPHAGEGEARVISIAGAELVRVDAAQVPGRVIVDLKSAVPSVNAASDLSWGARRMGQGNHPWYVQLLDGRRFKVSYGGQGKLDATVTEIQV